MSKKFRRPKGTEDILPSKQIFWKRVNLVTEKIFSHRYMFGKIELPIFENYDLFSRSSGNSSDIVSKQMYDFYDKGGRHIALRPEGTAGAVRAYVENKLYGPEYDKPVNLYYLGPFFRYERPQAGREREFHQLGVESFGSNSPYLDAQIIQMALDFFSEFSIGNLEINVNTLGNKKSRYSYRNALVKYLSSYKNDLSDDSKRRLNINPLRILDSKNNNDQKILNEAPKIFDYLDKDSRVQFENFLNALSNLDIDYKIDEKLVRGLDYYDHTIFEITTLNKALQSSATICGGGRYSSMVKDFGGPDTPAIGFGIGLERLEEIENNFNNSKVPDLYIISADKIAISFVNKLAHRLREKFNLSILLDYNNKSVKSQFKSANRSKARFSVVIGTKEISNHNITLKRMSDGKQKEIYLDKLSRKDFL